MESKPVYIYHVHMCFVVDIRFCLSLVWDGFFVSFQNTLLEGNTFKWQLALIYVVSKALMCSVNVAGISSLQL